MPKKIKMPRKIKVGGKKMKLDPETILIIVLLIILVALVVVYVVTNKPNTNGTTAARFTDYKEHFKQKSEKKVNHERLHSKQNRQASNMMSNINKLKELHNNKFTVYFVYTVDCPHSKTVYQKQGTEDSILYKIIKDLYTKLPKNIKFANGPNSASFSGLVDLPDCGTTVDVDFEKVLYQSFEQIKQSPNDKKLSYELANHIDGVPTLLMCVDKTHHNGQYEHYVFKDNEIIMDIGDEGPNQRTKATDWIRGIICNNLSTLQKINYKDRK